MAVTTTLCLLAVVGPRHVAGAATLQACNGDQVASATTDARRVGDDVVGLTAVGTWGSAPCLLHDRLTFAVQHASDRFSSNGVIRSIRGNPAARTVNVTVKPGDVLVYAWRWRNWCGAHGRYTLQAFWRALPNTTSSQAVKPPPCTDRQARSTLGKTRPDIATCSPTAYRVHTDLGQPFLTRLIPFVGITLRKGHLPCLLRRVHVTFAVQGQSSGSWSTLSPVRGNPGHRTVGAMLTQTYGEFDVFLAWHNWCGGGSRFRAFTKVGTRTTSGPTATQGATCEGPGSPSTLTPSYGHQ